MMVVAAYALAVLLPVLGFFWIPSGPGHGRVFDVGRAAGMAGFAILMMQAVLAARFKFTEKPFGFDMVIRFHQAMAALALLLLAFHPFLLAVGGAGWDLVTSFDVSGGILVGRVALGVLIVNVGVSIFRERLNLEFEKWRVLHGVLGVLLLVTIFAHGWAVGYDLTHLFYQVLWIAFLVLAVLVFLYHRFVRPAILARRPWRVTEVEEVVPKVWTLGMSLPEGHSAYDYLPGQFHFLTFRRGRDLPVEEHHFTISSSPTEDGQVASTIKESGDFTATIGATRVGDAVAVLGPFGRFSSALHPEDRKILFIAGGIGITPIRSMLRYMADRRENRDVVLLFGNVTESAIAFRQELEALTEGQCPKLRLVHILSEPGEDWTGPTGFVDQEAIKTHCADVGERSVYLCGPGPMSHMVRSALESLGVPSQRLREEKFSF